MWGVFPPWYSFPLCVKHLRQAVLLIGLLTGRVRRGSVTDLHIESRIVFFCYWICKESIFLCWFLSSSNSFLFTLCKVTALCSPPWKGSHVFDFLKSLCKMYIIYCKHDCVYFPVLTEILLLLLKNFLENKATKEKTPPPLPANCSTLFSVTREASKTFLTDLHWRGGKLILTSQRSTSRSNELSSQLPPPEWSLC